jgi:hypothetical protein
MTIASATHGDILHSMNLFQHVLNPWPTFYLVEGDGSLDGTFILHALEALSPLVQFKGLR